MSKVKRELNTYLFYDVKGMADHFEKMAGKGWLLTSCNNGLLTYRQIQPCQINFGVTYFVDASVYDIAPDSRMREYIDMCDAAGWKRVETKGQLQIFYNTDPNATPLETDRGLALEVIRDMAKRNLYIPSISLTVIGILYLLLLLDSAKTNVIEYVSSSVMLMCTAASLLFIAMGIWSIVKYFHWYSKAKALAADGEIPAVKNNKFIGLSGYIILIAMLGFMVIKGINPRFLAMTIVFIAMIAAAEIIIPKMAREYNIDNESSKKYGTIAMVITVLFLNIIMRGVDIPVIKEKRQPVDKIELYEDYYFNYFRDELPLYISDLTEKPQTDKLYNYEKKTEETFLIKADNYYEIAQPFDIREENLPLMYYAVYRPKNPYLYNMCRDELLRKDSARLELFKQMENHSFGYMDAYIRKDDKGLYSRYYVLDYGYKLVQITCNFDFDETMQKTAGEILAEL